MCEVVLRLPRSFLQPHSISRVVGPARAVLAADSTLAVVHPGRLGGDGEFDGAANAGSCWHRDGRSGLLGCCRQVPSLP